MEINQPAVRAFNRVWNPISQELDEAARADAGFDGGEFSGPAHAEIAQEEFYETLARVGRRFGLTAGQLEDHIMAASMHEGYMHWSKQKRSMLGQEHQSTHDALVDAMLQNPLVRRLT